MPADGLIARVAYQDDKSSVIISAGEIDAATAPDLERCLDACIANGCKEVIVDMNEVTFFASAGVSAVVAALDRLERLGGRLSLRNPSPIVRRVLEITGVSELVDIVEQEETPELADPQG